jgi:hypothetical protein
MGLGEEVTCIYCTSLQTSLLPVTLALLYCFIVALLVVKIRVFRFLEGKARPTCHLSNFLTCMVLFSPSMMEYLFYEPSGGSVMHGFCAFLSFPIVCKYGVVDFYDVCEMLMIVSRIMGIIKDAHWLFTWSMWFL